MSALQKQILEAALKLSADEREHLVEELAASLPNDFVGKDLQKAWLDELGRRSDEIDAGTAELLDLSDVREQIAQRRAHRSRP
ncbi:MAG TPA: addiction module protein [Polyangia bacterium]|jgi:putative addiction module component (TIGR02574 family)|nr:addiction module protein [Polyangia bacterium]